MSDDKDYNKATILTSKDESLGFSSNRLGDKLEVTNDTG